MVIKLTNENVQNQPVKFSYWSTFHIHDIHISQLLNMTCYTYLNAPSFSHHLNLIEFCVSIVIFSSPDFRNTMYSRMPLVPRHTSTPETSLKVQGLPAFVFPLMSSWICFKQPWSGRVYIVTRGRSTLLWFPLSLWTCLK